MRRHRGIGAYVCVCERGLGVQATRGVTLATTPHESVVDQRAEGRRVPLQWGGG